MDKRNFHVTVLRFLRSGLWLHGGSMLMLTVALAWLGCYVALPLLTRQGKEVAVPNLEGLDLLQAVERLKPLTLSAEVVEQISFSAKQPPGVVLHHRPEAGRRVKPGRKVYLTLNANAPPSACVPYLVDGSVRNAYMLLSSQGLRMGTVAYVPDVATGAVLEQRHRGKPIEAGTRVPTGSFIDLVVGLGAPSTRSRVQVPCLVGTQAQEAKATLGCALLAVGTVSYTSELRREPKQAQDTAVVVAQHPAPQTWIQEGEAVDLELGAADSMSDKPTCNVKSNVEQAPTL